MNFPLEAFSAVSSAQPWTYAVFGAIGFAFGATLEMAGFGDARKLAGQFYFRELTVLKVMFTAIIVAAAGLIAADAAGFMKLADIFIPTTFFWATLVGGGMVGAGMAIGGYCPGTCIAGIATGHKDAAMYGLGMLVGVLAFSALFPSIEPLTQVTSMGKLTLSDLFGLSYGTLTVLVVLIAVGGFVGATVIERRLAAR